MMHDPHQHRKDLARKVSGDGAVMTEQEYFYIIKQGLMGHGTIECGACEADEWCVELSDMMSEYMDDYPESRP